MAARKHLKTHYVEQTKKMVPVVSMSASWFSVTTYLIWIFASKLTLSNNQSRATLWVLDSCLTMLDYVLERTQKVVPFITCEVSFGQNVCELVFGVDVFDLDLGVRIDTTNQEQLCGIRKHVSL